MLKICHKIGKTLNFIVNSTIAMPNCVLKTNHITYSLIVLFLKQLTKSFAGNSMFIYLFGKKQ